VSAPKVGVRVNRAGVREIRYLVGCPRHSRREWAKAAMLALLALAGAAPILWVLVRMLLR
jgi:hypothetical protein